MKLLRKIIIKTILKEEEGRKLGKSLADQTSSPYVIIYRAAPIASNEFFDRDYVTLNKRFAIEHAESNHVYHEEPHHVIQALVSTKNVFDAYNPGEYFYSGPNKKAKEIYVSKGPGEYEGLDEANSTNSDNLIAYHGTDNRFENFDDSKPMFFVDDIDVAKTYGRFLIKAELKMDNPIELDFGGNSTYHFFDKWYLPSDLANKIKEISDDIKNHYSLDDDLKDYLEDLGFSDSYGDLDGIIMRNISDSHDMFSSNKPATNYVVFDRSQIRVLG